MLDNTKLDDLLALAEKPMFFQHSGETAPVRIDHETFRALVEEVQSLRKEVVILKNRIVCEDCGEISDDHECKEVLSKDDEPVRFAENLSPCSRSLCKDCGAEVHHQ